MKTTIIYPYTNLDFPSRKANMIQTINTCHALAKSNKVTVHFILRNPRKWTVHKMLEYYGLKECPGLQIHSVAIPYIPLPVLGVISNIIFKICLYFKIAGIAAGCPDLVIYARDLNVLSLIIKVRKLFNIRIAYEAHSIQAWFMKNLQAWHDNTKAHAGWKRKWYAAKERRVLGNADFIIAVTNKLKDVLVQDFKIKADKIFVVPDAAKLAPLDNYTTDNGKKIVGYAGQLNISRGVDVLVEAMQYLESNIELLVVGGDSEKNLGRLNNLTAELGLSGRVKFTGYIEPSAVRNYTSKMDILAMPHLEHVHNNNFASPLKMFEYMTFKKPIVATDLPSTKEILKDGENAVLVKSNSPEALASGIKRVFNNKELAERISGNAYKEVNEKYTYEKRIEKILTVLNGIN